MKIIIVLLSLFLLFNCSKDVKEVSNINETTQELEMISMYNEAYKALNNGDPYFAATKFLESEVAYPQSIWAPRSALMASYSYYLQNYYTEAISNLERFLKTYPKDENLAYAHYLIAMCYFESVVDEKRDLGSIVKAQEKYEFIIENYPSSEFSLDANFKLNLIEDLLASKEMYIARHYIKKKKWIPALNRLKIIIEDYDQTIFVEEALHRLVEINYYLGLDSEAKKYANVLGYNYLSSQWYKKTYKIFNKDYSLDYNQIIKKDKKRVIDKFKKLF
jgi:outer membrane protein assembly factor BamD